MCESDTKKHIDLIAEGNRFYESRHYEKALLILENAYKLAPTCPDAMYNYANVLHMTGNESKAYRILKSIIDTSEEDLKYGCPAVKCSGKGIQIDAYFLLFHVVLYLKGFCNEAFYYAEMHLKKRTRGVKSCWTLKEVTKDLKQIKNEFEVHKSNKKQLKIQR
jgi:tetratricopeptide (TPR) repeat protein